MQFIQFQPDTTRSRVKAAIIMLAVTGFSAGLLCSALADIKNNPLTRPAQTVNIEMITTGMLMDVATSGKRLVAAGERGHIIISDDGAQTWHQAKVPVSVTLTALCFPSADKGWVVGHDGVILHTNDGGMTWTKQMDGSRIPSMFVDRISGLMAAMEEQAGSGESSPADNSLFIEDLKYLKMDWQDYLESKSCPPFMNVWFKDEHLGYAMGGYGLIMKTLDGGTTWEPVVSGLNNPDGFHYYAMIRSKESLYLVGEAGMAFRSADWGKNWSRMDMAYDGSFFGIIADPMTQYLLAFGLRGNMVSSEDGSEWVLLEHKAPGGSISGSCLTSDGTLFLTGPEGSIYRFDRGRNTLTLEPEKFADAVSLTEITPGRLVCVGLRGVKIIDY